MEQTSDELKQQLKKVLTEESNITERVLEKLQTSLIERGTKIASLK